MKGLIAGGAGVALTGAVGSVVLVGAVMTTIGTGSSDSNKVSSGPISCMLPGGDATAAGLQADQVTNAQTIIATGKRLHVPVRGQEVAIAVAMQESTLQNKNYGDRDSLGLFQQRAPWGSAAERTNPPVAAELFYTGGRTGQPGLLDIKGWEAMPIWQAAQSVQVSGFPQAYAQWESLAVSLVGGATCEGGEGGPVVGSAAGKAAVAAAARWIGTPYSWGGGAYDGPTTGIAQGANTVGFDCSGLTMYAWFQATGVRLPHFTDNQAAALRKISQDKAQAGDLIFFTGGNEGGGTYPHMGILDGQGGMIHAPHTGANVTRVPNLFSNPYWSARIGMIGRPNAPKGASA